MFKSNRKRAGERIRKKRKSERRRRKNRKRAKGTLLNDKIRNG